MVADLSSGLRLDIEDDPSDADVEVLPRRLEDFNESRWPGHQPWKPLGVFVRDRESVVAGLVGETYCGWLFIRYLWVSDSLRGQGIGRKLMAGGEVGRWSAAATRRGSTRSAFKRPASIGSLAIRSSANSTGRPITNASSCGSGWRPRWASARWPPDMAPQ